MSGIYYVNAKMPEGCCGCPIDSDSCGLWSEIPLERLKDTRPESCPLIPVPDHGRLIDADALIDKIINYSKHIQKYILDYNEYDMCAELITQLELAPTIISADKEGNQDNA